ncbi:hypothetical protein [Streptomyces wuyuanensis]|uniref:hypothetical protein n=1 Tax=Streptomyces wuyuanensis TaxID=1196353 RepID=UPI003D70AF67
MHTHPTTRSHQAMAQYGLPEDPVQLQRDWLHTYETPARRSPLSARPRCATPDRGVVPDRPAPVKTVVMTRTVMSASVGR